MIIVKTPLRISFAGGGSDIPKFYLQHGGATLSTTINKYVYVMVSKHFQNDQIRVSYSKTENVGNYSKLEHTRVREALRLLKIFSGVEIVTIADVPSQGTGLGSSSSFTVGLLKALHAYKGQVVAEKDLAEEACKLEINILKEPIGKQDQYIASFGGLKFIQYSKDGRVHVDNLLIDPRVLRKLEDSLLLFYTGIQRPANSILAEQVKGMSEALKINNLKQMSAFAYAMRTDMEKGKLEDFGRILDESWKLKKSLAKGISNSKIDSMYKIAKKHGALGGKLLGAGGGGFLMVYAPSSRHRGIKSALNRYKEMKIKFDQEGSKILFINKNI